MPRNCCAPRQRLTVLLLDTASAPACNAASASSRVSIRPPAIRFFLRRANSFISLYMMPGIISIKSQSHLRTVFFAVHTPWLSIKNTRYTEDSPLSVAALTVASFVEITPSGFIKSAIKFTAASPLPKPSQRSRCTKIFLPCV